MNSTLRRLILIVGALLLLLFLLPTLIPTQDLKAKIVRIAYEQYNIALSIGDMSLSFFPPASVQLKQIKFSSRKQTLPFGYSLKGSAPQATFSIALVSWLTSGHISAKLLLQAPDITLAKSEEDARAPASSAIAATPADAAPLENISLDMRLENGHITWKTTEASSVSFQLKQLEAQSPKLSEVLNLRAWFELPKTKLASGAEAEIHARLTSNIQWRLPWTQDSFLKIPIMRWDVTHLSYVSQRYRVEQKRTDQVFVDIKNLEIHPGKLNELKTMVVRLDDHVLTASGKFTLNPLRFEGEIDPFKTSIAQFPFRLLQDTFPGASAELTFDNPLRFSYVSTPDNPQSPYQLQIELNQLQAKNLQLPLPWLLLEQPQATFSGKWQILPPKTQLGSPEINMIGNTAVFPKISLQWDGRFFPKAQSGELSFQPSELELPELSDWTQALASLAPQKGSLRIPSRFRVQFKKQGLKWETDLAGRFILNDLSGTWKNRYQFENFSGTFLLAEEAHAITCTVGQITPVPIPESEKEKNKEAADFKIQRLQIKAQGIPKKSWAIDDVNFTINNGQVKMAATTWDLGTQMATIGHAQVFHNDLASFLASFGGGWSETLQGKVRIEAKNIQLPITELEQPQWHAMRGHLDIDFVSISWIALPLQQAFTKYFQSYLEHFRVQQVVEKKNLTEYESTLNTSFTKGKLQLSLDPETVTIQHLELTSPEASLSGTGSVANLKSLKELTLNLQGTFVYHKPPFLYGKLRSVMLDPQERLSLPYTLTGTLTVPQLTFDQEKMFALYDERLKTLK